MIALALAAGAGFVIWSPLLMYQLLGESLPWAALADVGEAYGGASALLSAAALSGIGLRESDPQLLARDGGAG